MELVENMKATRKKIEPKFLVPVSPMFVASGTINHATVPPAGTPASGGSEALERVREGDYEEGMESPAGSLSFSYLRT